MKLIKKIIFLFLVFFPLTAFSQTTLEVRSPGQLYPIAVPLPCQLSGSNEIGKKLIETISRDLILSSLFFVIDREGYIESPGRCDLVENFSFSDWSVIGAESLVKGEVQTNGNKVKVRLFLHDVQLKQVQLAKEYSGSIDQIELIAHKFVNEILKTFTGISGVFGSEIVFSVRIGRFKELALVRFGSEKIYRLTSDYGLAVSASWHPEDRRVIYTTYRNRVPDLFSLDLGSKRSRQITKGSALEVGGKFIPGSNSILASQTVGRTSDLVLFNQNGQIQKN